MSELHGPVSSGRTSLAWAALAAATARGEWVALVDTFDRFDPKPAAAAGVELSASAVGAGPGACRRPAASSTRPGCPGERSVQGPGTLLERTHGPRDQGLQPGRTVGRVHDGGAGSHRCAPTGAHADTTVHVAAVAAGRRGDRGCPAAPGGDADRTKRGRSVDRDGSGEARRRESRARCVGSDGERRSRLPVTDCRLPVPVARAVAVANPGCRLPTPDCRLPAAGCRRS